MELQTHQLSNGIRIIHQHTTSGVAHCGMMINTGSRDETLLEQGISHFIEHALFKETKKRKAFHILSRMEDVGGELNAYTTKEETWYYATFMKEYYERSIELLSDILFNSTLPKKELEKEKDVIMDEIYSYLDSPSESIFDDYEELIYQGHPIGRNILGTKKTIKTFNGKMAKAYMKKHYNTDQMVLSSVGNISFRKLVRYAEKHLGSISSNNRKNERIKINDYSDVFNTDFMERLEYRNLYHFVKGGNDSLSAIRRETMFIQMLEGLHPQEADILTLVKDGNLERQYPKITKGVVDTAFPDIVWGSR